jgi:hypothetical protein
MVLSFSFIVAQGRPFCQDADYKQALARTAFSKAESQPSSGKNGIFALLLIDIAKNCFHLIKKQERYSTKKQKQTAQDCLLSF